MVPGVGGMNVQDSSPRTAHVDHIAIEKYRDRVEMVSLVAPVSRTAVSWEGGCPS
jgi:hypothetical protein